MAKFSEQLVKIRRGPKATSHQKSIPQQRFPSLLRVCIQLAVVPFLMVENGIQQAMRLVFLRSSRREGRCIKSGTCCQTIVAHMSPWEVRVPLLRKVTLWWATEVNGFVPRNFELDIGEGETRVYSCRHLKADGTCARYWARPALCRSWPRHEWFGKSHVLKGCGFRFASKKGPSTSILDD